jgi:hypothetical protein
MTVLAYLGSQCTEFNAAGWTCWFLCPFICSRLPGLMRFRDYYKEQHTILCKSRNKRDRDPGNYYTSVRGRQHKPCTGVCVACSLQGRPKKGETGDCPQRICPGKPNSHFRILLWRFMTTALIWRHLDKFGDKKLAVASRQSTVSHFLFYLGTSDKK